MISSYAPTSVNDLPDVKWVNSRFGVGNVFTADPKPAVIMHGAFYMAWATSVITFTLPKISTALAAGMVDGTLFCVQALRSGVDLNIAASDPICSTNGISVDKLSYGALYLFELNGSNWRVNKIVERPPAMFYPSIAGAVDELANGDSFMYTGNTDQTLTLNSAASMNVINGCRFTVSAFMAAGKKVTVKPADKIIISDTTNNNGWAALTTLDINAGETYMFIWDQQYTQWFAIKN